MCRGRPPGLATKPSAADETCSGRLIWSEHRFPHPHSLRTYHHSTFFLTSALIFCLRCSLLSFVLILAPSPYCTLHVLLPHLSVTHPLLFTRPPDRLGRGSHFEAPAHTSCMTLAMLLYLACSDLAGYLLGSPKMPASGAIEYREYHVNQLAWAKTTAYQSSALLSSALLCSCLKHSARTPGLFVLRMHVSAAAKS